MSVEQPDTWKPLCAQIDFTGILDASGITTAARYWTGLLIDEYRRHARHNDLLLSYYDGNVTASDYGVRAGDRLKNDQSCDWPQKAVTAWADRISLEGFVLPPETDRTLLDDVVDRNNLVNAYNEHVPVKGLYGCMAATVNRSAQGHAVVRFHGADTFTAIPSPDYTDGVVAAGLAVARREFTEWSTDRMVPTIVNLHLPGNVGQFRQTWAGQWTYEDGPTREELPTLYVFTHERVGSVAPFGRTRITKFVRTLTDDAIRCMWHMQVSGTFYSMAKLWMTGLSDEQFDAVMNDKDGYQLSRILAFTVGGGDENPQFGQLSGNSPQPFIDELRSLACQFSGATSVPLNSLGIVQDNPSSSEAIVTSREDICMVAKRDIQADKATLRRVMRAALAMESNVTTSELDASLRDVKAKFANPITYGISARADYAAKVNTIIPGYGQTEAGMRMVGIDEEDIPEVQARVRQAEGMRLATATMEARAAIASASSES